MSAEPRHLDIALRHAARGFRVLPLHSPIIGPDGAARCSCPKGAACDTIGKHPRVGGWPKGATTDEGSIRHLWGRWPEANVGIATGRPPSRAWQEAGRWRFEYHDAGAGLLVLDVDSRHGGDETLADLEAEHGKLPHTVRTVTGGGGAHILLTFDGDTIRNNQDGDTLGPGLDIRADGGQFVAPGSLHQSRRRYQWEASCHPEETPIAPAPPWLLDLLRRPARPLGALPPATGLNLDAVLAGVPDGKRNATVFRLASYLRGAGIPREWAEMIVGDAAGRCRPPLSEAEAMTSLASAYDRYQPRAGTEELLSAALKSGVVAESNSLPWKTAREIGATTPPTVEWLAEPWVAMGAITELDGKLKASGKTTWTLALCRAVLDGAPFMDKPTIKSGIVYLTEQPARSFREGLRRAGLLDRADLHVLHAHDVRAVQWPDLVAAAIVKAKETGCRLLVVDTLPQFAGLRGDAENNAGAALAAMEPLQDAAAVHDLGILVARHERKSGGEVGDSGRGSSAFGGAVDVVLSLRRGEGATRPTVRVIQSLSRFDETPDTLTIELDEATGQYMSLGDQTAIAVPEAMAAILAAAPDVTGTARTLEELLSGIKNVKRTIGQKAVAQLVDDRQLLKVGAGRRGDPHRYCRAVPREQARSFLSATTPLLSVAERIEPTNGHHPDSSELLSATTTVAVAERKDKE